MAKGHDRLDKRTWARLRVEIFNRDGYRCVMCHKAGRLECDHKKPLSAGGAAYSKANLQTLCRGCHIEKTRLERGGVVARGEWEKRVASIRRKRYF